MEVRTDSGTIFTSNCSHEQHTYNTQVDDALPRTSGIYCSLQTSTSARLLIDALSRHDTIRVSRSSRTPDL